MKTINATDAREVRQRPAAAGANPVAAFETSIRGGSPGDLPLTIRVTVSRDDGLTASHRHTRAEDEALDAEDIITQAEEAGALDPVG